MISFSLFYYTTNADYPGIIKKVFSDGIINLDVSGCAKQTINGTKQLTKPEYAIYPHDTEYDWCSNCGKTYEEHPWMIFSMKNKKFKFDSYFVRCGCCYHGCCCEDGAYCVSCCLYSWSLQVSDDNKTWTEVHRVDRDDNMRHCNEKSYKLDKEYRVRYVRITQNEPCPSMPPCMSLNKIDFFGDVEADDTDSNENYGSPDDDEDVSIIGHISRNARIIA